MDIVKNPAQEAAINTIEGPVLLISCPGSGKTTTLVRRIHHMIETGISPSNILMVTFTRDAAKGMKDKYQSLFSAEPGVTFQTIHSLCFNILLNEGVCRREDVLYNERQMEFFLEFMRSKHIRDAWETAVAAVTGISCARNNYLQPEQVNAPGISKELFLEAYRVYAIWKDEHRVIDFDDMLIKCGELLTRDAAVLKKYQDIFKYIQCDEYQDTNYIQRDILYALTSISRNLCVVGDDDQSIYAFRGAHPEIMLGFQKDFPDAKIIRMGTNYRSAKKIVEFAGNLAGHNSKRFKKDFESFRGLAGAEGRCVVKRVMTRQEEMAELVASIKKHHDEGGIPYNHMAVLFRTNVQAQNPVRVLSATGIPYYSTETVKSKYEGFMFRDFRDYVSLSCGTGGERELLNVLNHPNRYFREKEFRGIKFTEKEMSAAVAREMASKERWQYDKAVDSVRDWLELFGPGVVSMETYPRAAWSAFIDDLDYMRYICDYAHDRNLDLNDLLAEEKELRAEAFSTGTLEEWFKKADAETARLREEMAVKDRNGVVLTTMHRAKGLEWDVVYIIDADEYITPHKKSMETDEQIEEERRLFYVAMTRARDELIIMGTGTPSRFLSEMNANGKGKKEEKTSGKAGGAAPVTVPKKLAGSGVEHKKFGFGRVVGYEPGVIVVSFSDEKYGEKKLQFPETFNKGTMWYK